MCVQRKNKGSMTRRRARMPTLDPTQCLCVIVYPVGAHVVMVLLPTRCLVARFLHQPQGSWPTPNSGFTHHLVNVWLHFVLYIQIVSKLLDPISFKSSSKLFSATLHALGSTLVQLHFNFKCITSKLLFQESLHCPVATWWLL